MREFRVNLCRQRIVQAFIIGTADLADIAAIDDSLNLLTKFQIHDALVLSLKGQTALGIHAAIANQAGSGAGCHTAVAVSAAVVDGLIRLDVQIGDEFAQKHIGTKFLGDDQAVLADKADSCSLGYSSIDQGTRVHHALVFKVSGQFFDSLGKPVQLVLQDIVVVQPPAVRGEFPSLVGRFLRLLLELVGVGDCDRDDGLGRSQTQLGLDPFLDVFMFKS